MTPESPIEPLSISLVDRILSEAAIASRPGQMERLEAIADEVEQLILRLTEAESG